MKRLMLCAVYLTAALLHAEVSVPSNTVAKKTGIAPLTVAAAQGATVKELVSSAKLIAAQAAAGVTVKPVVGRAAAVELDPAVSSPEMMEIPEGFLGELYAQAVQAKKDGDPVRYRELMNRYWNERKTISERR